VALATAIVATAAPTGASMPEYHEGEMVRGATIVALVDVLVSPFPGKGRLRVVQVYKGPARRNGTITIAPQRGLMMTEWDARSRAMRQGQRYFVYLQRVKEYAPGGGRVIARPYQVFGLHQGAFEVWQVRDLALHELIFRSVTALDAARTAEQQLAALKRLLDSGYEPAQIVAARVYCGGVPPWCRLLPAAQEGWFREFSALILPDTPREVLGGALHVVRDHIVTAARLVSDPRTSAERLAAAPVHRQFVDRVMALLDSRDPMIRRSACGILALSRATLEMGRGYSPTGLPGDWRDPDVAADQDPELQHLRDELDRRAAWWAKRESEILARWRAWYESGGHRRAVGPPPGEGM
jgi:hypothetical protein